jgi:hypothetical protein
MDGCLIYRAETMSARFDDAIMSATSDIPGMFFSSSMLTAQELRAKLLYGANQFGNEFAFV